MVPNVCVSGVSSPASLGADFLCRLLWDRAMSARRQVGILNWNRPLTLNLLGRSRVG